MTVAAAAAASFQADLSPESQDLVERILSTPEQKRPGLIGELRQPDGSLAKVARQLEASNPEFFRSLLPELAPRVREAPADPTTDVSAFVNLVYETPQAKQKELREEVDRPNGRYMKVVRQLQSSNSELFRSLFPVMGSPVPTESKVSEADVGAFVNRIIDATQDQLAELRNEVWNRDGSLTELGQKMDAELRGAFFPQIDPDRNQAPSAESKSTTEGYSISPSVFLDLGLALGKLRWDAQRCDPIKEKLATLQGPCKSKDEAMYAMSQLYTQDLPALLDNEWNSSELRRVLGDAISKLSVPVDEEDVDAERGPKRKTPDALPKEPYGKKARVEEEKRREDSTSPSPQPSSDAQVPSNFAPSAQRHPQGYPQLLVGRPTYGGSTYNFYFPKRR